MTHLPQTTCTKAAVSGANTEKQTTIRTSMGNLESSINLTPLTACLWAEGGV